MTLPVEELALHLVRLARQRIDSTDYKVVHLKVLRRNLISWCEVPTLQAYVPRLLHYCLECGDSAPPIVLHVFRHLTGQSSTEELGRRLQAEAAVLDQLSSVPWSYGIRALNASATRRLVPLIPPDVPIDPGKEFRRAFRTSRPNQAYARLDLFAGSEAGDPTAELKPLLSRRVKLPDGMLQGERVDICIQRVGDEGMRLDLRVARNGEAPGCWWWLEDSAVFSDLSTAAQIPEKVESGPGKGLRLLLQGCFLFLNRSWHLLPEEDANRLAHWAQQTASALVLRDEEGIKNALRLLLVDLDAVRNESVAVVLEKFLVATEAPQGVTMEFERVATLLLKRREESAAAWGYAWTAVADWYHAWQRSNEITGLDDEPREQAGLLFAVLQTLYGARSRGEIRNQLGSLLAAVQQALANRRSLQIEVTEALSLVHEKLSYQAALGAPAADTRPLNELQDLLADLFVKSGEEVLRITLAPAAVEERFLRWQGQIRPADQPIDRTIVRTQMVQVISAWNERWRRERDNDVKKIRQAEMLMDLLGALEEPEMREEAVASLMKREPLESGLLRDFVQTFRTSRWTRDVQREVQELIDYHLRVIDRLGVQWQQEDSFRFFAFQNLAESAGLGELPAEDQEPLGDWRAPATEEERREPAQPTVSGKPVGREVSPADADELLEEIPDGLDSSPAEGPRLVTPPESLGPPV